MKEGFKLRAFIVAIFTGFVIILLMRTGRTQSSGSESIYYYHLDHLGTPLKLTDQNKNIVWSIECSPFMEFCIEEGNVIQPLRFPGQYYDEETGLHYNWHRYYKPEWGRYVEADPLNIATIQIPPTSPIRMPVNRFSYSIILSPKAIMRDVNQLFILFVSDKKFYSGTLMAQMKKNILTPMILIYTQHPPFLNLFLYVVNNPLNYVDPSGKGVKGPWGNLPWFLEPPYCPFYQMGAWYLCWEECEEKKCKRKGCITQCVWEYYQGTGNPMYPLPGLSFE